MNVRKSEMYNQRCSKLGLRVLLAVDEYEYLSTIGKVEHSHVHNATKSVENLQNSLVTAVFVERSYTSYIITPLFFILDLHGVGYW